MNEPALGAWFQRRIFRNIPWLLERFDPERGSFSAGTPAHQHCLRPLAWYALHPADGNPIHGDARVLEMVLRAGDAMVAAEKPSHHGGTLGGEWVPFNLLECCDWLGERLGSERRERWRGALARHIERQRLTSNYIATAPNHFAWRAAVWARASLLFDRPEWMDAARMLARQLCKAQMPDGYWDEAHRGHGPSGNYHRVQLHGLDLYYRISGDEAVRPALDRGIAFAVRTAYPDGLPIETFDGRQPYAAAFAVGMAAGALSRTPEGRRLLRLQCRRCGELGLADAAAPCGFALFWYVFATTDFLLDNARFCEEGDETPLPQEASGHREMLVLQGYAESGGAATCTQGDWFAAVSAIESDVPRFISNVYITERQAGFSLYHRGAGLLVGGGNRMRNHAPLAHAVVLTGWDQVDCRAGVFQAPYLEEAERLAAEHAATEQAPFAAAGLPRPHHEGIDPVKGCYHPIRRSAEILREGAALTLDFMHGSIRFECLVLDDCRVRIRYAFETCSVRKLLLQVPVPLFHPFRFEIDGAAQEVGDLEAICSPEVRAQVAVRARGHAVRYVLPPGRTAQFTHPLEPIRNGRLRRMNYVPDERFRPLYVVGLLSQTFEGSLERGSGELVTVEVAGA